MGKKKDKDKDKAKDKDRPRRKDLTREVERLQAENEELRALLQRIAELAGSGLEQKQEDTPIVQAPILVDASAT